MKKRILGILLSVILVSVCVGCDSESTVTEQAETAAITTAEDTAPEQTTEVPATPEETEEPHTHNHAEEITTDATCEADGIKSFTCECGDTYTETIPATGHVFENYVSNNDATYTADGTETAKCNTCDLTDTRTAEGSKLEYTYTEMNATMYATQTVNVRDLPTTDGNKVGSLSTNDEVAVTGICNETGWYQIVLDENEAFVSNKYLGDNKVEVSAPPADNGSNGNSNAPAGVPNPYEYSEYTWHDMGGWMFMICDKEYGNSERNHLPAVNILRERYPGAYIYYMCGQQLNDGSGRWLYLASADGTDPTTRLTMTSTYCK